MILPQIVIYTNYTR